MLNVLNEYEGELCVQAADFLDDKTAVAELCSLAAHQLFAPCRRSGLNQLDADVLQASTRTANSAAVCTFSAASFEFTRIRTQVLDCKQLARHPCLQDLYSLPRNLHSSVLAASRVPAVVQRNILPKDLQCATLHARFPSILATASLTVRCPKSCDYADPFLALLACETSLTSLKCASGHFFLGPDEKFSQAFLSCIGR